MLHAQRALAQVTTLKLGYLADPSHEAALWALRNGKVTSQTVRIESTPLDIAALIQATAARSYDVIETAAIAVPRARERGLDLRIIGTGLRYHISGEGSDIWVKRDSPIRSAADLKGRKLAIYAIGSRMCTASTSRNAAATSSSSRCRRPPCRQPWPPGGSMRRP
jgi:NitT/TauT family transport system substrate-binding protein